MGNNIINFNKIATNLFFCIGILFLSSSLSKAEELPLQPPKPSLYRNIPNGFKLQYQYPVLILKKQGDQENTDNVIFMDVKTNQYIKIQMYKAINTKNLPVKELVFDQMHFKYPPGSEGHSSEVDYTGQKLTIKYQYLKKQYHLILTTMNANDLLIVSIDTPIGAELSQPIKDTLSSIEVDS